MPAVLKRSYVKLSYFSLYYIFYFPPDWTARVSPEWTWPGAGCSTSTGPRRCSCTGAGARATPGAASTAWVTPPGPGRFRYTGTTLSYTPTCHRSDTYYRWEYTWSKINIYCPGSGAAGWGGGRGCDAPGEGGDSGLGSHALQPQQTRVQADPGIMTPDKTHHDIVLWWRWSTGGTLPVCTSCPWPACCPTRGTMSHTRWGIRSQGGSWSELLPGEHHLPGLLGDRHLARDEQAAVPQQAGDGAVSRAQAGLQPLILRHSFRADYYFLHRATVRWWRRRPWVTTSGPASRSTTGPWGQTSRSADRRSDSEINIYKGWAINLIFRITRVSCARRSCPVWCTPPMTGYTASTPILASSPCLTLHSAHCHRKIHIFWLLRRARILNKTLTMKGSTLLWSPSFYDNNNHYISIVIELQTLFNTSRSNLLIVKLSWKSWLDLLTGPGEQGGPLEFRTLEQLLANFDKYQISRLNLKTRHPTDKIKIIIKKSR